MTDTVRVLVADDHPLYREGVAWSLSREADVVVVGQAADATSAMAMTIALLPHIVLLDLSMPGGGGLGFLARLADVDHPAKIVVLTVSEEPDDVATAFGAGASGYLLKGIGSDELLTAVRQIACGHLYMSPTLAAAVLRDRSRPGQDRSTAGLTTREEDVVRLLSTGMTNREIGHRLFLAEKTVKHHITQILHKLPARNRLETALWAQKHGYATPEP